VQYILSRWHIIDSERPFSGHGEVVASPPVLEHGGFPFLGFLPLPESHQPLRFRQFPEPRGQGKVPRRHRSLEVGRLDVFHPGRQDDASDHRAARAAKLHVTRLTRLEVQGSDMFDKGTHAGSGRPHVRYQPNPPRGYAIELEPTVFVNRDHGLEAL